jgi:transcriptional regulator with GAF, ATPase, and Fis domain
VGTSDPFAGARTGDLPWLHFVGTNGHGAASQAALDLAEAGLATRRLDGRAAIGPGLVFFDAVTDGLYDFLREISREGRERVLAVATASAVLGTGASWRLLEAGASDVFAWDHSTDPASEIVARLRRWEDVDRLAGSPVVREVLAGDSPVWMSVLRQVVEVARFADVSVLITGESGTGKELVARLIHLLDPRPGKRELVLLDCTTVVPSLSGSEFFGHERGAFTSAVSARDGAFAMADGGTLFLDEVGELSLALQAELLRVVQEGTYKRVGGNTWRRTSFRLICATNRDLAAEETRGAFRRDFYHRIASWHCHLPSLGERSADILPLARHFLAELIPDGTPPFDRAVRELLLSRDYPGNVRELRHLVARIAYRHAGPGPITVGDIPPEERPSAPAAGNGWSATALEQWVHEALAEGVGLKEIGRITRDTAIRIALLSEDGNLQRASRALGVTDRALQLRRAAALAIQDDGQWPVRSPQARGSRSPTPSSRRE